MAKACNIFGVSSVKPIISKNPFMISVGGMSKSGLERVKFTTTYLVSDEIKRSVKHKLDHNIKVNKEDELIWRIAIKFSSELISTIDRCFMFLVTNE